MAAGLEVLGRSRGPDSLSISMSDEEVGRCSPCGRTSGSDASRAGWGGGAVLLGSPPSPASLSVACGEGVSPRSAEVACCRRRRRSFRRWVLLDPAPEPSDAEPGGAVDTSRHCLNVVAAAAEVAEAARCSSSSAGAPEEVRDSRKPRERKDTAMASSRALLAAAAARAADRATLASAVGARLRPDGPGREDRPPGIAGEPGFFFFVHSLMCLAPFLALSSAHADRDATRTTHCPAFAHPSQTRAKWSPADTLMSCVWQILPSP